ncbi:MAG: TerC/Alx family metal homeostasis membrane protein [Endomicrobium sp.]|jgi:tellurite resistance protein TerC|nr:TerC/Alx family metal homeostasis membrane protein [Endomicrobium sp.]
MDIQLLMWVLFWIIIISALFIDLVILNKYKGNVKIKKAIIIVCIWIGLALSFGSIIYFAFGIEKALDYITGYVVEYSLSVDNMLVFFMIFTYFVISKANQSKVLIYGVIGAVILRFLFVFIGIQLINTFTWIIYIFGAVLVYTAVKIILLKNKKIHPENNIAYKIFKILFPFKSDIETNKFFIREKTILYATPMFAAVIVIEMSDIMFAIDSIPAILSISRGDTFVVYTSNIFAIVGLRSLYFLLSNLATKFKFLQFGVAIVLLFVGLKMIISYFIHIPTVFSLCIIIMVLIVSIIISCINKSRIL